jgi:polysaccharide biosynthesis protein PslH
VCSERERAQLLELVPEARIAVIENGVDCAYFAEPAESEEAEPSSEARFVFVGSMDYFPNADAVLHFANRIWPAVRKRLPGAKLDVVGARPSGAVRALRKHDGIVVTGTVPDVRPFYQRATASVVPLRTGGGTRLKILESMAAGVPVVSTALGAEGLAVEPDKHYLLAGEDDAEAWARHLASLATDGARREALAAAGKSLASERYDWPVIGARLVETYREWLAQSQ